VLAGRRKGCGQKSKNYFSFSSDQKCFLDLDRCAKLTMGFRLLDKTRQCIRFEGEAEVIGTIHPRRSNDSSATARWRECKPKTKFQNVQLWVSRASLVDFHLPACLQQFDFRLPFLDACACPANRREWPKQTIFYFIFKCRQTRPAGS